LLEELFPKYLDSSCFRVINGGKDVAQALLDHPYGHILFTGGTAVAKEVMKSAARFLTPLTLELGGRNAVVVSDKANVELAAKRTAWAKFANAGQICLAPNVVVVHEAVYEQFVAAVNSVCVYIGP
jgi:acyl-CoA reductase-like NAD-dependent aldehyde dehydrogenase